MSLELGGKSPNIILDDVDLEKAVNMGMKQCFFNTGQSCSSPTRMLIPEAMLSDATKFAIAAAESMTIRAILKTKIFLGPISNKTQYEKVQTLIQKVSQRCNTCMWWNRQTQWFRKGYYVKPTVFTNVNNKMTIAREEIFWSCNMLDSL